MPSDTDTLHPLSIVSLLGAVVNGSDRKMSGPEFYSQASFNEEGVGVG